MLAIVILHKCDCLGLSGLLDQPWHSLSCCLLKSYFWLSWVSSLLLMSGSVLWVEERMPADPELLFIINITVVLFLLTELILFV